MNTHGNVRHNKRGKVLSALLGAAALMTASQTMAADLPEGYVELESVRPAWTLCQYVDTGYTPASTDKLEMDVTFINADREKSTCLWCARDSSFKNAVDLFWEGSVTKGLTIDCGNNSGGRKKVTDFVPKNDTRYVFTEDCNARTFSIDGVVRVSDFATGAFTSDKAGCTLTIFASRAGQSGALTTTYGTYALHSFTVTDKDGEAKLALVPAYETATGLAGLYDTVGKKFITCSVTSNTKSRSLAFVAGDAFGGELPPKFKRVSWVKTVGDQYLNTFLRPLSTDTIEMKVNYETLSGGGLWCSRDSSSQGAMDLFYNSDKTFTVDRGNCTKNSGRYFPSADFLVTGSNYVFKVDYQAKKFYVDGVEKQALGDVSFEKGGSDLFLFAGVASDKRSAVPSGSYSSGSCRYSGLTVKDKDGNARLDLVPCQEEATKIAGLYDLVTGSFMTAMGVSETPSFDYGIDGETYTAYEWASAPGGQWINADFTPCSDDVLEMKLRFSALDKSVAFWCARASDNLYVGSHCVSAFFDPDASTYRNVPMLSINRDERTLAPYAFNTETDYTLTEDCSNAVFYVNGIRLTALSTETAAFTASGKMSLFAGHSAGTSLNVTSAMVAQSNGRYRLYSFTVKGPDGKLKVDLRPAKLDSDGTVGLYDYARERFFSFVGDGAEVGNDVGNRWTLQPTVEPLAWTAGETPAIVLGEALKGTVVCNKTAADLAALAPGEYDVIFSVDDAGEGMSLEKTVSVTVSAAPDVPVYPSAPFVLESFSRRTRTVSFSFGANAAERSVYLAWGARDAGADFLAYGTNFLKLCAIPAGTTSAEATIPEATFAAMADGGFRLFLTGEKPVSSDYASDGLVVHYDAIDNAGRGEHAARPSVWKNLGSGEDLDLPIENCDTVFADSLRLTNLKRWTTGSVASAFSASTFEADVVPFFYWNNNNNPRYILAIGRFGYLGFDPVAGIFVASPTAETASGSVYGQSFPSGLGTIDSLIAKGTYQTYAAIPCIGASETNSLVLVNGVSVQAATARTKRENSITDSFLLQVGHSMAMFDCHSLRVYNRELTAAEIVRNARVDAERFGRADCLLRAEVTPFRMVSGGLILFVH